MATEAYDVSSFSRFSLMMNETRMNKRHFNLLWLF